MAEWSKAHDWKSCVPLKGTVSSNLTLSAIKTKEHLYGVFFVLNVISGRRTDGLSEFDYK